jgi:SAM-dependent methyltransferase
MKLDEELGLIMSNCRACGKSNLELLLDFGNMPLAGGFLEPDADLSLEKTYPLPIHICKDCGLVQNTYVIPPAELFDNYLFSSCTIRFLVDHFANYARWLKDMYDPEFVVEFGCNDGVLLSPLDKMGVKTCGVDISHNITGLARGKGCNAITGYFNLDMAKEIKARHGTADIVTGSNAFPHNDHPEYILIAAREILRPTGHLCLEMMYAGALLEKMQWDSMYHEHLSYFCLTTLEILLNRYGFHSVHAEIVPMHAGSLRVVASLDNTELADDTVMEIFREEINSGITDINNWRKFAEKVKRQIRVTDDVLYDLDCRIWAYGASGRATMWLNACQMYPCSIVDESPLRIGKLTPGTHTKIVSIDNFHMDFSRYCLVTAWNYFDQIRAKCPWFEGVWIIPAPELRFV